MLAHLNHQISLDDQVTFLPCMGGQLNIPLQRFGIVDAAHVKRLGNTVTEGVGQVVVGHTVGAGHFLSGTGTGDGIGLQLGAVALDDIGDVDAQRHGAAIDKRKV